MAKYASTAADQAVAPDRRAAGDRGTAGERAVRTDALGSLLAETDQSQAVTQRYHYLPFGGAYGTQTDGPGYTGAVMKTKSG